MTSCSRFSPWKEAHLAAPLSSAVRNLPRTMKGFTQTGIFQDTGVGKDFLGQDIKSTRNKLKNKQMGLHQTKPLLNREQATAERQPTGGRKELPFEYMRNRKTPAVNEKRF